MGDQWAPTTASRLDLAGLLKGARGMEMDKTTVVLPVEEGLGKEPIAKHPYGGAPIGFASKRSQRRKREDISDVAFIMGIPEGELTPSVQEALTIIMKDFDRQRDELEHARE